MSFLDIRFPVNIKYGTHGGPSFNTTIISFKSGNDTRNINWDYPRGEYDVAFGVKQRTQLYDLMQFFSVVAGMGNSFRFKDWMDFKSCRYDQVPAFDDCQIDVADGIKTQFQLMKVYRTTGIDDVTLYTRNRKITKPVPDTVLVGVNGAEQASGWTVDTITGIITFAAPPTNGHAITSGYEFDVHANFETDFLDIELVSYRQGDASVPIKERKEVS